MTITFNKFSFIILLMSLGILFSSCRTSEEIAEPEPEPEMVEEEPDDQEFTEPDPEPAPEPDFVENLQTVSFGFDRDNITDQTARVLAENVSLLRENSNTRVRVDAYTDHVGGDQYNLRLSLRRAAAVVEFYKQNGIAESRIESRGLGKAPVPCAEAEMDSNTPGCEKNRRAESHPLNPTR